MTEHDIQNLIRLELSKHGKVFRTNAGEFWQGTQVFSKQYNRPVLLNIRKVAGLPQGFSDLLFIDEKGAAFIEVKTPVGVVSREQERFIEQMQQLGQRAGVARSVEDALNIIKGEAI